jgi:uncharacterized protein (DUF983 family)
VIDKDPNRLMDKDPDEVPLPPLMLRLGRAVLLRCPFCGGGPLRQGWMKLRPRCPRCGLHTERGEHDFYLGAMMFNLVIAEGIMIALLVGFMVFSWPEVPWDQLYIGGLILMAAAPFILFPFSRTIWMAFDLMLHPPTHQELAEGAEADDRAA